MVVLQSNFSIRTPSSRASSLVLPSYNSYDDGKYSDSEECTFSRTCESMQGFVPISRVSCRYPCPREFVHIKLHVCSVSFSHNYVSILMVYRPHAKFAYSVTCRFRD